MEELGDREVAVCGLRIDVVKDLRVEGGMVTRVCRGKEEGTQ